MTPDPLENLLRHTDARTAPPPARHPDLASRAFSTAHARSVRRKTHNLLTLTTLLLITTAALLWHTFTPPTPTVTTHSTNPEVHGLQSVGPDTPAPTDTEHPTSLEQELASLRAQADHHLRLAERLWEAERRAQRRAYLRELQSRPDPLEEIQRQIEFVAFAMLYQADRMANELDLPEPAQQMYRDLIDAFPDTPSAATARDRLVQHNHQPGAQL